MVRRRMILSWKKNGVLYSFKASGSVSSGLASASALRASISFYSGSNIYDQL